jgi:putative hydrolase of the HAD superfamily
MIKVIFFDAAGTLFYLPRSVGWHYREVAERFGCHIDENRLQRAFRALWQELPTRPSSRVARPDDDKNWWRELVGRMLDVCGVSVSQLDRAAYFEQLYQEFIRPGVWQLFPEVREVITTLRPRFQMGVISNFDGRLRPILDGFELGGVFEPLVISSEVGADKPDAWIFQRALDLAGIAPGEALHVGDDPVHDWQGAAAAGMHVFKLERPANSLRDLAAHVTALSAS